MICKSVCASICKVNFYILSYYHVTCCVTDLETQCCYMSTYLKCSGLPIIDLHSAHLASSPSAPSEYFRPRSSFTLDDTGAFKDFGWFALGLAVSSSFIITCSLFGVVVDRLAPLAEIAYFGLELQHSKFQLITWFASGLCKRISANFTNFSCPYNLPCGLSVCGFWHLVCLSKSVYIPYTSS